jgi:hypothetical protein
MKPFDPATCLLEYARRHKLFRRPIIDELIPLGAFGSGIFRRGEHGLDGRLRRTGIFSQAASSAAKDS